MQTNTVIVSLVPKELWSTFREEPLAAVFTLTKCSKNSPKALCGYVVVYEETESINIDSDDEEDEEYEGHMQIWGGATTKYYKIYGYAVKHDHKAYHYGKQYVGVEEAINEIVEIYNKDLEFMCGSDAAQYKFVLDADSLTVALGSIENIWLKSEVENGNSNS